MESLWKSIQNHFIGVHIVESLLQFINVVRKTAKLIQVSNLHNFRKLRKRTGEF